MSGGFVGVFHFDPTPVDSELVRKLTALVAHRGPDGDGDWTSDNAAIGFCAFWTVPEAVGETHPVFDPEAGIVLTLDGRIDNRDELAALLGSGITPEFTRTASDARLLLAAFVAKGADIFNKVFGDFAAVIWNTRSRELLLARDRVGVRPLYYSSIPGGVIVASELRAILAHPEFVPGWNQEMFASVLAEIAEPAGQTLYRNISKVKSGHLLFWTAAGVRQQRYWVPKLDLLSYRREAEYAEQLNFELDRSVRSRLRSHGGLGTYLSGGLDSSSVTAVAHRLAPGTFQPFSIVFPGAIHDETFYIKATESHLGLTSAKVPFRLPPPEFANERIDFYRDATALPNFSPLFYSVATHAAASGVRTILGGGGGNAVMECKGIAAGEALLRLRFDLLFEDFRHSDSPLGPWLRELFGPRLRPVAPLPQWARVLYRRLRNRPPSKYPGVNAEMSGQVWRFWSDARADLLLTSRFASQDQFWRARQIFTMAHIFSNEQVDRDTRHLAIDERHPFFDARLIEFTLRVPSRQLGRGIRQKWMLREAMQGFLPEVVRNRIIQSNVGNPAARATPPSASDPARSLAFCLDAELTSQLRAGYRSDYDEEEFGIAYRVWAGLTLARLIDSTVGRD